ncbi:hypothetical protein TTHERM_00310930 (macronuclear) [Tetrahymena thermophila SB210]|uniref:Uncharacterized protein n=1 Tax=Tetrahymena thermophila (strain SB210) TaxID=312017 RepID=I7MG30_TETTS|nr:hypothetical protein TTHERM_00310930 [Tetrahymena thermophila SB210]EAS00915.2 hypothetical protein TTHERM_00310930 [Tetrahymena thermophila SB210]|eukprot:XP_001021161.2 hypothetical protein TTHERM_00310930 [Tetrahymena thermophila SB210]
MDRNFKSCDNIQISKKKNAVIFQDSLDARNSFSRNASEDLKQFHRSCYVLMPQMKIRKNKKSGEIEIEKKNGKSIEKFENLYGEEFNEQAYQNNEKLCVNSLKNWYQEKKIMGDCKQKDQINHVLFDRYKKEIQVIQRNQSNSSSIKQQVVNDPELRLDIINSIDQVNFSQEQRQSQEQQLQESFRGSLYEKQFFNRWSQEAIRNELNHKIINDIVFNKMKKLLNSPKFQSERDKQQEKTKEQSLLLGISQMNQESIESKQNNNPNKTAINASLLKKENQNVINTKFKSKSLHASSPQIKNEVDDQPKIEFLPLNLSISKKQSIEDQEEQFSNFIKFKNKEDLYYGLNSFKCIAQKYKSVNHHIDYQSIQKKMRENITKKETLFDLDQDREQLQKKVLTLKFVEETILKKYQKIRIIINNKKEIITNLIFNLNDFFKQISQNQQTLQTMQQDLENKIKQEIAKRVQYIHFSLGRRNVIFQRTDQEDKFQKIRKQNQIKEEQIQKEISILKMKVKEIQEQIDSLEKSVSSLKLQKKQIKLHAKEFYLNIISEGIEKYEHNENASYLVQMFWKMKENFDIEMLPNTLDTESKIYVFKLANLQQSLKEKQDEKKRYLEQLEIKNSQLNDVSGRSSGDQSTLQRSIDEFNNQIEEQKQVKNVAQDNVQKLKVKIKSMIGSCLNPYNKEKQINVRKKSITSYRSSYNFQLQDQIVTEQIIPNNQPNQTSFMQNINARIDKSAIKSLDSQIKLLESQVDDLTKQEINRLQQNFISDSNNHNEKMLKSRLCFLLGFQKGLNAFQKIIKEQQKQVKNQKIGQEKRDIPTLKLSADFINKQQIILNVNNQQDHKTLIKKQINQNESLVASSRSQINLFSPIYQANLSNSTFKKQQKLNQNQSGQIFFNPDKLKNVSIQFGIPNKDLSSYVNSGKSQNKLKSNQIKFQSFNQDKNNIQA